MAHPDVQISCKETTWIFFSSHTEPRHLYDIVLGVDSLRKINVGDQQIYIFTDNEMVELELAPYSIKKNIYNHDEFEKILIGIDTENIFAVITGHGTESGLPINNGLKNLTPYKFFEILRSAGNVKNIISVMCQCYGGIFNYVDAYNDPKMVVLGATNLNLSMSIPISIGESIEGIHLEEDEDGEIKQVGRYLSSWSVNIFLFYLFEWIRKHVDVDGDGKMTVIDMFKYAGSKSSNELRKCKSEVVNEVKILESEQLSSLVQMGNSETPDDQIKVFLQIRAQQTNLNNKLQILYNHQEPWILNSNHARAITVD